MSNNLRQAAQAALEALEKGVAVSAFDLICAKNALRAALAEPQPEPVTREQIRDTVKECGLDWHRGFVPLFDGDDTNRYEVLVREVVERFAAPQASLKPLTDEQIGEILHGGVFTGACSYQRFARAIERAHGIGVKP